MVLPSSLPVVVRVLQLLVHLPHYTRNCAFGDTMASSRLDFLFCHLCGTLLTVPSTEYAQCPLCKTRRDLQHMRDREISYTIYAEDIRRELGMEVIEEQKVQLSKVNKKCEKCGHDEANFYTRQMRSADEGQTTFYTCTRCGHQSQEN